MEYYIEVNCARATCANSISFLTSMENKNKLLKNMYNLCHRYILKYANLRLSGDPASSQCRVPRFDPWSEN